MLLFSLINNKRIINQKRKKNYKMMTVVEVESVSERSSNHNYNGGVGMSGLLIISPNGGVQGVGAMAGATANAINGGPGIFGACQSPGGAVNHQAIPNSQQDKQVTQLAALAAIEEKSRHEYKYQNLLMHMLQDKGSRFAFKPRKGRTRSPHISMDQDQINWAILEVIGEALVYQHPDISVERLNKLWHTNTFTFETSELKTNLIPKTLGFSSKGKICEFKHEEEVHDEEISEAGDYKDHSGITTLQGRNSDEHIVPDQFIYSAVLQDIDVCFSEMKLCSFKVSKNCISQVAGSQKNNSKLKSEEESKGCDNSSGNRSLLLAPPQKGDDKRRKQIFKQYFNKSTRTNGIFFLKNYEVVAIIPKNQTDTNFERIVQSIKPFVLQKNIRQDYLFWKKIGKGTFGDVHLATRLKKCLNGGDRKKAVKVMNIEQIVKEKENVIALKNEISIHWELMKCNAALKLEEIYTDKQSIFLVLEYQEQGSLLSKMLDDNHWSDFDDERQTKLIMTQLLLSLDFMHNIGIVHRDIKLDNILINKIQEGEYNVKIADFGLAHRMPFDGSKVYEICGTPGYIAPEVLRNEGYNEKSDIFSLGAVLFNMLTGDYIFCEKPNNNMMEVNRACDMKKALRLLDNKISPYAKDLVLHMLEVDQNKRYSARESLLHPWFSEDKGIIYELLQINKELCCPGVALNNTSHSSQQGHIPMPGVTLLQIPLQKNTTLDKRFKETSGVNTSSSNFLATPQNKSTIYPSNNPSSSFITGNDAILKGEITGFSLDHNSGHAASRLSTNHPINNGLVSILKNGDTQKQEMKAGLQQQLQQQHRPSLQNPIFNQKVAQRYHSSQSSENLFALKKAPHRDDSFGVSEVMGAHISGNGPGISVMRSAIDHGAAHFDGSTNNKQWSRNKSVLRSIQKVCYFEAIQNARSSIYDSSDKSFKFNRSSNCILSKDDPSQSCSRSHSLVPAVNGGGGGAAAAKEDMKQKRKSTFGKMNDDKKDNQKRGEQQIGQKGDGKIGRSATPTDALQPMNKKKTQRLSALTPGKNARDVILGPEQKFGRNGKHPQPFGPPGFFLPLKLGNTQEIKFNRTVGDQGGQDDRKSHKSHKSNKKGLMEKKRTNSNIPPNVPPNVKNQKTLGLNDMSKKKSMKKKSTMKNGTAVGAATGAGKTLEQVQITTPAQEEELLVENSPRDQQQKRSGPGDHIKGTGVIKLEFPSVLFSGNIKEDLQNKQYIKDEAANGRSQSRQEDDNVDDNCLMANECDEDDNAGLLSQSVIDEQSRSKIKIPNVSNDVKLIHPNNQSQLIKNPKTTVPQSTEIRRFIAAMPGQNVGVGGVIGSSIGYSYVNYSMKPDCSPHKQDKAAKGDLCDSSASNPQWDYKDNQISERVLNDTQQIRIEKVLQSHLLAVSINQRGGGVGGPIVMMAAQNKEFNVPQSYNIASGAPLNWGHGANPIFQSQSQPNKYQHSQEQEQ